MEKIIHNTNTILSINDTQDPRAPDLFKYYIHKKTNKQKNKNKKNQITVFFMLE